MNKLKAAKIPYAACPEYTVRNVHCKSYTLKTTSKGGNWTIENDLCKELFRITKGPKDVRDALGKKTFPWAEAESPTVAWTALVDFLP